MSARPAATALLGVYGGGLLQGLAVVSFPASATVFRTLHGLFPLTVAIASKRFAGSEAVVSSLLTAALMLGVGAGSFALGALQSLGSFDFLYRLAAGYPLAALLLGGLALALTAHAPPERTARETS